MVPGPMVSERAHRTAREATEHAIDRLNKMSTIDAGEHASLLSHWIDAHFALVEYGVQSPNAPVDYSLFPEHQQSLAKTFYDRWKPDVAAAMLPPMGKTSPVSKLFRKGLPVPSSLRYINQQMQRACAMPHPISTAMALRDICVSSCRETWSNNPNLDWRQRYKIWKMCPADLYTHYIMHRRPVEVQAIIGEFVVGIAKRDPLLCFMHTRQTPSYFHCSTMLSVLCKVAKRRGNNVKRKRQEPHSGFGLQVVPLDFENVQSAVALRNGIPPSAKRIRGALTMTPTLSLAIERQTAPSDMTAPLVLGNRQTHLPSTWACRCSAGCGWLKRPLGGGGGDVIVDMEADTPQCAQCSAPAVASLINGQQLRYASGWARLCNNCGVFTRIWHLQGEHAVCKKCIGKTPGGARTRNPSLKRRMP